MSAYSILGAGQAAEAYEYGVPGEHSPRDSAFVCELIRRLMCPGTHAVSPSLGAGTKQSKDKAIAAGVVGGILFFVAAIVLSVCAVKICNKRKRRKSEKGLPSHEPLYAFCLIAGVL